jgi:hypothetical protein
MSQFFIISLIVIFIIIIALYLDSTKENFQDNGDKGKLTQMFNDLEVAEKRCADLEERQKLKNDMNQIKENELAFNQLEELDKKIQELKEILKELSVEKGRRDNINDKCKENTQVKLNQNYDLLKNLNKDGLVNKSNLDLNLNISDSLKSLGLGGVKGTAKSNKKCNIESSRTHVNLDNNDIAQKCNKCDISKLKKNYYKFKKDFE